MADGRLFTDYRPRCDIAGQFTRQQGVPINGSYEYRQWLIHNGGTILNQHRAMAIDGAHCSPCSTIPTMPMEKDTFVCSKTGCSLVPNRMHKTQADRVRAFGTGRSF